MMSRVVTSLLEMAYFALRSLKQCHFEYFDSVLRRQGNFKFINSQFNELYLTQVNLKDNLGVLTQVRSIGNVQILINWLFLVLKAMSQNVLSIRATYSLLVDRGLTFRLSVCLSVRLFVIYLLAEVQPQVHIFGIGTKPNVLRTFQSGFRSVWSLLARATGDLRVEGLKMVKMAEIFFEVIFSKSILNGSGGSNKVFWTHLEICLWQKRLGVCMKEVSNSFLHIKCKNLEKCVPGRHFPQVHLQGR